MENLKEKLTSEKEKVKWIALEEHHEREALLIIKNHLDLIDVGVSIANDDVQKVKEWLSTEDIKRPDEEMVNNFKENDQTYFEFIIIQPYVLAQQIED
jgi:hypothetical protein